MNLSLDDLRVDALDVIIFSNAPSLQSGAHCQWHLFSMPLLKGVLEIVGIPVPCCDRSVVELCMSSLLGPFQTL